MKVANRPGRVTARGCIRSGVCCLPLLLLTNVASAYNYITCPDSTPLFAGSGHMTFNYANNLSAAQKSAIATGLSRVTAFADASITTIDNADDSFSSGNGENEIYLDLSVGTADCAIWFYTSPTCEVSEADIRFGDEPWVTADDSTHWPYGSAGRSMTATAVHEGGHCVGMAHSNDLYNMMGQEWNHVTRNGSAAYYGPGEDLSAGLIDLHGKQSATDSQRDVGVSVYRYSHASGAYSAHAAGVLRDAGGASLPVVGSYLGEAVYRVVPGTELQMELTFENNGEPDVESPNVGYYLSDNSVISATDTLVYAETGYTLGRDAPLQQTAIFSLPGNTEQGNYFLGAYVDHDGLIDETTVANNVAYYPVSVPPPDLTLIGRGVSTDVLIVEQSFNTWGNVQNNGAVASATTLRFYVSTNATISVSDTQIGSAAVPALDGGASLAVGTAVMAPATPGTYWIGACVDSVNGETVTSNQCSTGLEVIVEEAPPGC